MGRMHELVRLGQFQQGDDAYARQYHSADVYEDMTRGAKSQVC